MRKLYVLQNEDGYVIAQGSYDSLLAVARLYGYEGIVNIFERQVMDRMNAQITKDVDSDVGCFV